MAAPNHVGPSAQGMVEGRHVTAYLRIIYKRRWVALATLLVVFFWGTIDSLKTTPVYEATVQILVERQSRSVTSIESALDLDRGFDTDFLPTELNILQSRALARRTLAAMDQDYGPRAAIPGPAGSGGGFSPIAIVTGGMADALGLVGRAVGAPERIEPPAPDETTAQAGRIGEFLGGLRVEPVRNTVLVGLRYRSPDPVYAERAANALAKQYIQHSIERRFAASQEANSFLGEQLEEQRARVEESEAALQRYLETNRAVAVDDRQDITVQRLADLNAAVTQARMVRIEREASYAQVNRLLPDRAALDAFPAILGNAFIQQLKTEVAELQGQRETLAQRYGERHPEMIRATTQLQNGQRKLEAEIDNVVESIRTDFMTAQAREASLVESLEAQRREALARNQQGIEYAVLQREAVSNRELYDSLLQRANESGISGEFRGTNIQVVDDAEVPRTPVEPNRRRDLATALVMGLVLALGLVAGLEHLDSRIKSPEEMKRLGLPFLGMVPVAAGKAGVETPLINNNAPPAFTEAIRSIRTAIVFSSPDEASKLLVVTSTAPHEGKTLVACNLALALAQAGQRTLLIDGDLRRPRVHDVFLVPQEPGMSNLLVGDSALAKAMHATSTPGLSVIAAGHLPPNPAELLGSKRYDFLMAELKRQFEWVVIDAPPAMAVTDASVLAHGAGGVVFVVGSEMTALQSARAAVEQLASAKARFVGAVLNRVHLERHAYYYAPYYKKEYTQYYRAGG